MFNCRTNEEMFVCLKYDLLGLVGHLDIRDGLTHDNTFENSFDGDITKLSFDADHEMRCCMLWSSSMLCDFPSALAHRSINLSTHLYSLWMNAVCTTLGC